MKKRVRERKRKRTEEITEQNARRERERERTFSERRKLKEDMREEGTHQQIKKMRSTKKNHRRWVLNKRTSFFNLYYALISQ